MSHKLVLYVPVRLSLCEPSLLCLPIGRHAPVLVQPWLEARLKRHTSGSYSRGQDGDLTSFDLTDEEGGLKRFVYRIQNLVRLRINGPWWL